MPTPPWSGAAKLACASLAAGMLLAQQQPVIRVDVQLVHILATVKNSSGEPVTGLEKPDFEIRDNGVPQQVAVFERQSSQPLSVAMLVDTSGSTAIELRYELDSVNRFLRALFSEGNPEDMVALYSFNYEVTRQNYFTHNLAPLERSLKSLRAEAGTALYDAIYLAAQDLERRDGRKVMVVVTDGGDTFSHKDFHAAVEAAQLADAVIYPVLVMPIKTDVGRNIGGENALTTMSQWTGGRVFKPTIGSALDAAFTEIIKELRTQYLLGYYPKNVPLTKDRFHRLDVKVRRPDLRVVARNGYYGEADRGTDSPPYPSISATPEKKAP